MTEAEKQHLREVYEARQIGARIEQAERDMAIRETVTADAIQSLRRAFQLAAQLPMRPSSGLVQYYEGLKKVGSCGPSEVQHLASALERD
jgi:hypothetical protein